MDRIKAHPEFRVFGNMNPTGDAGKRDLPLGYAPSMGSALGFKANLWIDCVLDLPRYTSAALTGRRKIS